MAKNKAVPQNVGRPKKLFDRNIAKDRKVSKFHLDRGAEEQADIFGYWSDLKAPARKKVENLNLDLEIKTGEKFAYYKDALNGGVDSKGNKKSPTDTSVNNAISTDEEIIAIKRDIIEHQEYLSLIESAIKTMDQRRSSIKVLESLNHDNYFESQGKSADEYNARESRKEKTKDNKNQMAKKMSAMSIPEEEEVVDPVVEEEEFEEDTLTVEEEIIYPEIEEENTEEEVAPEPEEDEPEEDEPEEDEPEEDEPEEDIATEMPGTKEENPCPYGKVFGNYGHYDECDDCDKEGLCFRESKKK